MFGFYVRILCSEFMFGFYVRILCSDFMFGFFYNMFGFYVQILCSDFMFGFFYNMFGFYVRILCSEFMFIFYVLFRVFGFYVQILSRNDSHTRGLPHLARGGLGSPPPCPIQIPTSETARYGCTGLGICTSFACHVCWEGATPATLKLDTRSGLNMYAKCYWAFQSHVIRSYTSPGLPVHHQATCTGQHTAETQTKIFSRTQFGLSFDRKGWAELVCVSVRGYLWWDGGWLLWGVVSPREMQQIIKHAFLGCSFRIATSEHACSRVFNQLVCG